MYGISRAPIPRGGTPVSLNLGTSLPMPLGEPYRLRKNTYTLPVFFHTDGWTDSA